MTSPLAPAAGLVVLYLGVLVTLALPVSGAIPGTRLGPYMIFLGLLLVVLGLVYKEDT